MTQFLPPNLLALFEARDPIPYWPPAAKLPHEKKKKAYDGVGAFVHMFEHPSETPPPTRVETRGERLECKRRARAEQMAYRQEQEIALWDPMANPKATSDPFKTLFVARINYDTSKSKLRREFEAYGPIKNISLVHNKEIDKSRGYAFIEYEYEQDMHSAYRHADGKKIDGQRVLVDMERARIVKGWLPRRLGGGLGDTRRGGDDVNITYSGREDNDRKRKRYHHEQHERYWLQQCNRDRAERPRHEWSGRDAAGAGRRRSWSRLRRRSASRSCQRERETEKLREEEAATDESRRRRRRRRSHSHSERRRERRERDKKRNRRDRKRNKEHKVKAVDIKIKEEPLDNYDLGDGKEMQIKQEPRDDENTYNPEEPTGDDENIYNPEEATGDDENKYNP